MKKQRVNKNFCNLILTGMCSVILLLSGCTSSDLASVSPKEAATMFFEKKAIILDVREEHEWKEQHIAGAIHIPLAQVESRVSELEQYKDSNVVVQCRSGKRSAKAASSLKAAGFTKVFNLTGGIIAWGESGLKVTKPAL
jgi:rhodanese-related sulfurtransferase